MHDQSRLCSWAGYRPVRVLLLAAVVLLLPMLPMSAQAATPGAGNILQQTQPKQPPTPTGTNTGLKTPTARPQQLPQGVSFHVTKIRITGNTLFSTATLHALVAGGEGKSLDLQQLQALSERITTYYHKHGYSLSRAIIPAQQIKSGVVEIRVLEAHFGKINLNNRSRAPGRLLGSTLSPLHSGGFINDQTVNRALLLLSDIPGVSSSATLSPGAKIGTSKLDVTADPTPLVTGDIMADNYGNKYTGRARGGVGLNINDPLHLGDELSLNFMSSGEDMDYGRASYDVVLNGYGTSVGASYSYLHYILGGALSNLRGYGTASVGSGWLRQPLIRSRMLNLYGQAQYDYLRLRDHIDATGLHTDRHLSDGTLSLSGDLRDSMLGTPAVTTWDVSWTLGDLTFDNATAKLTDAATAGTAGRFSKWNGTLVRLQGIDAHDSLYLMVSGQWSNGNLDSVEKLVVGGPYSVRGYDIGMLSADEGYLVTGELRHRFDSHWQVKAFFDSEGVNVNSKPWVSGVNSCTLNDAGLGLDINAPYQWHLQGYIAFPVGNVPTALASNHSRVRGWVQVSKAF